MKKISFILLSLLMFVTVKADEGMWMLPLIQKLNIQKMQGLGLTLTADQIYSDTNTSLKDAVVIFGGGCTGVMVSPNGLVFTNHHCGYNAIQQHSTVEHNYLKDGFSANELKDEIPSPGLSVTFLVKIEDVTNQIAPQLNGLNEKIREEKIDSISTKIENEAIKEHPEYTANVKPFFAGNEFYLFVYEKFNDVRFVFAPPSSIGKFGGETDNWMYPRHTGDFSIFRVYCSPDGKPAGYSPNNVPFNPKKYVNISNQGYKEGDYAMILGNPGTTERYATSWAIKDRMNNSNNARIEMRGVKQDVWKKFMRQNEAINIAYANKFASSSNYWKNSIGMNNAIRKLQVIQKKEKEEQDFAQWVNTDSKRVEKYGNVLKNLKEAYEKNDKNNHAIDYLRESLMAGVELPRIANFASNKIKKDVPTDSILKNVKSYYKDYYPEVDKETMSALIAAYRKAVPAEALPDFYTTIDKKFKGNSAAFVDDLFKKSVFVTPEKLASAIKKQNFVFYKDPAVLFYSDVQKTMHKLRDDEYIKNDDMIKENERLYEAGLLEIASEKNVPMYPDANFTMRLTYGTIQGYKPADAVSYRYYTTTKGILEKEDPQNPEFVVPEKLKQNILSSNYGNYKDSKTGEMNVAFISNDDITGGNSGSPIFNSKGELIGLAFDGNWESLSGDIIFDPELQRCIGVDIRYVLFVMDKVGGAGRLIKELTIN